MQEQLEGLERNKHMYDYVAEELRIYGIKKMVSNVVVK